MNRIITWKTLNLPKQIKPKMDIGSLLNEKDSPADAEKPSNRRESSTHLSSAATSSSGRSIPFAAEAEAEAAEFGRRIPPTPQGPPQDSRMNAKTRAVAGPYFVQQGDTGFRGATDPGLYSLGDEEGSEDTDYLASSSHSTTQESSGFDKPLSCSNCEKRFTRRSDLVRHERIHSGHRPHVCLEPGCGKSFIQRSALTVHARVHSGCKPHLCTECGKPFSDSSSLARHRRIHTGQRPYVCDFPGCNKDFTRRTTLTRHQNHHTAENGEPAEQGETADEYEQSLDDSTASMPPSGPWRREPDEPHQQASRPESRSIFNYSFQSSASNEPRYPSHDRSLLSAVAPASSAYSFHANSEHGMEVVHYPVPRAPQPYETSNYPPLDCYPSNSPYSARWL